jgi:hypothetical protein
LYPFYNFTTKSEHIECKNIKNINENKNENKNENINKKNE